MADFPLFGGIRTESAGFDLANTTGTTVTAAGSANTKGAYVELLAAASNEFDSYHHGNNINPINQQKLIHHQSIDLLKLCNPQSNQNM